MGIYIGIGNHIGRANLKVISVVVRVRVRVIDKGTGLPLVGAIVVFEGKEYVTDANGQVILKGFENSSYPLIVKRQGHESVVIDRWKLENGDIYLTDVTRNILAEIGVNILTEDGGLIFRDLANIILEDGKFMVTENGDLILFE